MSLSFGNGHVKIFLGKGITHIGNSQYLVEREDGQLEFIDPTVELYKMKDVIATMTDNGKKEVLCPNTKTLNHPKNQWGGTDVEKVYECTECNAKLDIRTNKNIVKVGEAK